MLMRPSKVVLSASFTSYRSASLIEAGQDNGENGTRHGCLHDQNMIER